MYEHDGVIRSRYDYYYSVSSPAISQATNFFENQHASLFGDPVMPLLPQAIPIPNQLLPPGSHHHSSQSPDPNNNSVGYGSKVDGNNNSSGCYESAADTIMTNAAATGTSTTDNGYVGYNGPAVATPLIDNFDQHLYESIRRNFLDSQKSHAPVDKSQLWQQHLHNKNQGNNANSSGSDSPTPHNEDFESKRKRTCSALGSYEPFDESLYDLSPSKYRALSARSCSLR